MISRDLALLNDVPEGAYIVEVVEDSAAEKAGLKVGDIITKIDSQKMDEEGGLAKVIQNKKVGDKMALEVWRDGESKKVTAVLKSSE